MCGYVVAIAVDTPIAYMQPIEPVLREISRVFSVHERVFVEVPSSTTIARLVQEHEDYLANEGTASPPVEAERVASIAQHRHLQEGISPKREHEEITVPSLETIHSDDQYDPSRVMVTPPTYETKIEETESYRAAESEQEQASASRDGTVQPWDAETGVLHQKLQGNSLAVGALTFLQDGRQMGHSSEATALHEATYPIGIASGLPALATFALKSCLSLYQTIESFQTNTRIIRELKEELEAFDGVLRSLQLAAIDNNTDLIDLNLPLLRCGKACRDFKTVIIKCTAHSSGSETVFQDSAKLKYMGNDIAGFKDTLMGYKSTISIALSNANLYVS